ncbi:MAG TPA: hypothetical protein VID93_07795 [Acidimicrobiales bacterium]
MTIHRRAPAALLVGLAGWFGLLALAGCGSSSGAGGGGAATALAGPPVPTTSLPAWVPPALGIAGEDALVEVVSQDLRLRGLKFAVDEQQGVVSLEDGRVLALGTLAETATGTDPTTWPALVAHTFDVLLAP